jgi:ABC-type transport system involved in Fe-S cluster assembly fused permease/ATPase subunit
VVWRGTSCTCPRATHCQYWTMSANTYFKVYVVGGSFFHFYVLLTLMQWTNTPGISHFVVWILALAGEVVILVTSIMYALAWHRAVKHVKLRANPNGQDDGFSGPDAWERIDLVTAAIRTILFISLIFFYLATVARGYRKERHLLAEEGRRQGDFDERTPLLGSEEGSGYDTQTQSRPRSPNDPPRATINGGIEPGSGQQDEGAAFYRPTKVSHKSWWEYCRGYSVFFQYLWPNDSVKLQLLVLLCIVLVGWMRAVNVLVPIQFGNVVSMLTATVQEGKDLQWTPIWLFILYKSFQNNAGFIGAVRGMLWVPVSQHTYKALTTAAFEHVHSLSLDFHLSKRTGELLSALNKGSSINNFLEQVTFNVLPMIFDLLVAIVFFYWEFGPVYALAVAVITFYYLHISIQMARTRADERREMVNKDREEEAVKNDSITSYETVKYFNAEGREFARYRDAMAQFQAAEAKVFYGVQQMNIAQTAVFMAGIFVIVALFAFEVAQGSRTVAEFVSMMSYLTQLQGPLNFFSTFYRTIQQAMIAGERLLELFKIKASIVDPPGVPDLKECIGHVRWKNVKFSYNRRKPALRNLNFDCPPGTTTAFVGESGGGKSTVFRLMFRFYNCEEGSIEIDGQDVTKLSIDSVRKFIGVVPQDPNLFNETLMFNLKYANPEATDEDVFEACRAAAIHDRIMSFPDGYNTKVGERGLKLSGGEKQRVAIARTILKKPKIIMLDEATSALDGETEQKIQAKLINGSLGPDRTLLIIA